jgi:hypothetical protein
LAAGVVGHNSQRGPSEDHSTIVWARILFDDPGRKPRCLPLLKIENLAKNHLKMISSETAGSNGPKLWWNGLSERGSSKDHFTIVWAHLTQQFQRRSFLSDFLPNFLFFVQRPRPPTKMATVTKNRKFSKKSLKNDLL